MNAEHGETEGDESPEAEENVSPKQMFNMSDIWELKPNRSSGMAGTYHSYIAVCVYEGWFVPSDLYQDVFYELCVYLSLDTTHEQSIMHDTIEKEWHNKSLIIYERINITTLAHCLSSQFNSDYSL